MATPACPMGIMRVQLMQSPMALFKSAWENMASAGCARNLHEEERRECPDELEDWPKVEAFDTSEQDAECNLDIAPKLNAEIKHIAPGSKEACSAEDSKSENNSVIQNLPSEDNSDAKGECLIGVKGKETKPLKSNSNINQDVIIIHHNNFEAYAGKENTPTELITVYNPKIQSSCPELNAYRTSGKRSSNMKSNMADDTEGCNRSSYPGNSRRVETDADDQQGELQNGARADYRNSAVSPSKYNPTESIQVRRRDQHGYYGGSPYHPAGSHPDNMSSWSNVGPTSGRQARRWANIGPTADYYQGNSAAIPDKTPLSSTELYSSSHSPRVRRPASEPCGDAAYMHTHHLIDRAVARPSDGSYIPQSPRSMQHHYYVSSGGEARRDEHLVTPESDPRVPAAHGSNTNHLHAAVDTNHIHDQSNYLIQTGNPSLRGYDDSSGDRFCRFDSGQSYQLYRVNPSAEFPRSSSSSMNNSDLSRLLDNRIYYPHNPASRTNGDATVCADGRSYTHREHTAYPDIPHVHHYHPNEHPRYVLAESYPAYIDQGYGLTQTHKVCPNFRNDPTGYIRTPGSVTRSRSLEDLERNYPMFPCRIPGCHGVALPGTEGKCADHYGRELYEEAVENRISARIPSPNVTCDIPRELSHPDQ